MKKILLILLILPINVFAIADNAKSSILINFDTGIIMSENNANEELPMASMTKMMTLLLVMEKIENGSIKLTDMVPISKNAASMGGSQVYLEENTKMELETLIRAICIASANDAAVAVAEYVAGSTDEFVKLMNNRAQELGLKNTKFQNVHGLDANGHYSSAHDMAFIAKELLTHELILKYSSIYEDYIKHPDGTSTWIVNTNKLINYYDGLDGLKTGYTNNSGYCITATAKRNGMRLISVVMGEENNSVRNQDTMELLNYGFSNYQLEQIVTNGAKLGDVDVLFGKKEKVPLKLIEPAVDLVKISDKKNYSYQIQKEKITAPIKVGERAGKLLIYADDVKIKEYDLTINENVERANFLDLYLRNIKNMLRGDY